MSKARIFISEDEMIISKDLEDRLKRLGYTIAGTATTGVKTLQGIKESKPDLILLDILLKGPMDGIQVGNIIRTDYDIPIIYLTAYSDTETLQRAKLTEPFAYILKPFEQREIYITLEIALYKHKLEKNLKESIKWLESTLNSIGDGIIGIDSAQIIQLTNSTIELLTGWNNLELIGNPLDKLIRMNNKNWSEVYNGKIELNKKDGTFISMEAKNSPLYDKSKNVIGYLLILKKISILEGKDLSL